MGLLNNWLHKKDKDQLKDTSQKKPGSVKAVKEEIKKSAVVNKTASTKHADHTHAKEQTDAAPTKPKMKLSPQSTAYKVLIKALVTEKSAIAESKNKYSFVVNRGVNKNQVREAVAELYGVKPNKVNIINTDGRQVRFGRSAGRRSDYKKAIVTLPAGSAIDIHAGV